MTSNIGTQAADAVNEKLVERQKLEQELLGHHQDLGTLVSQRNENEMVKEVRKVGLRLGIVVHFVRKCSHPFNVIALNASCSTCRHGCHCHLSLNLRTRAIKGVGNMRKRISRLHNLQTGWTSSTQERPIRCNGYG